MGAFHTPVMITGIGCIALGADGCADPQVSGWTDFTCQHFVE